jgi:hypothetical protein
VNYLFGAILVLFLRCGLAPHSLQDATSRMVRDALADAKSDTTQTKVDVDVVIDKGTSAAKQAAAAGRLTSDEANKVVEVVRMTAATEFGNRHEDAAIRLCVSNQIVSWRFSCLLSHPHTHHIAVHLAYVAVRARTPSALRYLLASFQRVFRLFGDPSIVVLQTFLC